MAIKKVLVADDSLTEVPHLSEILGRNSFKMTVATDNKQTMTKPEAETFDLILMDVMVLGQNGYQATRVIKEDGRFQGIPVIMCTTRGLETGRVWDIRQGTSDYTAKPVRAEELLEKIAKLVQ